MLFAVGRSEGAHFLLVDGSNITTDTRPESRWDSWDTVLGPFKTAKQRKEWREKEKEN